MNYIYYRSYCFYQKNGLAFDPHTWAVVPPTVICSFLIHFAYYLLVSKKVLPIIELNALYFIGMFFGFSFLFERFYKEKFKFYNRKWKNENKTVRLVKGLFIFPVSLGSFIGIFVIANEFHKMRNGII
jgi:hypothetical protein